MIATPRRSSQEWTLACHAKDHGFESHSGRQEWPRLSLPVGRPNGATSRAGSDNGNTSGLHPEDRGSIPRRSTKKFRKRIHAYCAPPSRPPLATLYGFHLAQVGRWCGVRTPNSDFLSSILSRPARGLTVLDPFGIVRFR